MARKVFVSFRFSDGAEYKDELCALFDNSTEVINCSEDEDRSNMSDSTIQKYLYDKLKDTSVTIVLLTPDALQHRKDCWGNYNDWMYDEIRYSLEDREKNRTNGLIAVYTPEAERMFITTTIHTCSVCNTKKTATVINQIDNLSRKNLMNVFPRYKTNPCVGLYDLEWDSYCNFVSWDYFKDHYSELIEHAAQKRDMLYKYDIKKRM